MRTVIYLDDDRRAVLYGEGGLSRDRRIDGPGWCLADDNDHWPDLADALRTVATLCNHHAADAQAEADDRRRSAGKRTPAEAQAEAARDEIERSKTAALAAAFDAARAEIERSKTAAVTIEAHLDPALVRVDNLPPGWTYTVHTASDEYADPAAAAEAVRLDARDAGPLDAIAADARHALDQITQAVGMGDLDRRRIGEAMEALTRICAALGDTEARAHLEGQPEDPAEDIETPDGRTPRSRREDEALLRSAGLNGHTICVIIDNDEGRRSIAGETCNLDEARRWKAEHAEADNFPAIYRKVNGQWFHLTEE